MRPLIPDMDSDLGRTRHNTLLNRALYLLDGARVIVTSPSSPRTKRLVVADWVGETQTMDGERVKQITLVADGEVETTTAEDGEAEGAGPRLVMFLVLVVVDGVPPARTMTPLMRLSRPHRMRPPIPTPRFRLHQITPGAHLWSRLTMPGVHLVGAPQTTLGRRRPKLHRMSLSVTPVLIKRRERNGGVAFRMTVGPVGAMRPTLTLPLVCNHPEEAGEILLRLSPRSSVLPKVPVPTLSITFFPSYCHCT